MKVLLCLLSDQPVPNLLSVHHFQPDHLVLIETAKMKLQKTAARFLKALQIGGLDYNKRNVPLALEREDDLESITRCVKQAFGQFSSAEWIVNLTGGTKPMSIATYEFFKGVGRRLIYINVARPAEILPMDGRAVENCAYRLSMEQFLAAYGFESAKRKETILRDELRARRLWPATLQVARHGLDEGWLHLSPDQRSFGRKKGLDLQPRELRSPHHDMQQALKDALQLTESEGSLVGKPDKYDVQFLTGGWLEVFLWGLLDQHQQALNIWDVHLGVAARKTGVKTENDIDVAFLHNHSLCTLECKSGLQEHDKDADVLYKVEAVIRQFEALRVRSYLATTSPHVYGKGGDLKANIQDRSTLHRCTVIHKQRLRELAESPDSIETVRDVFFPKVVTPLSGTGGLTQEQNHDREERETA